MNSPKGCQRLPPPAGRGHGVYMVKFEETKMKLRLTSSLLATLAISIIVIACLFVSSSKSVRLICVLAVLSYLSNFALQSLLSLYFPAWRNDESEQSWIDWKPASEPETAAPKFREQTSQIVSRLRDLRRALSGGPLAATQRWPATGAIEAVAAPDDRLFAASSEISERLRGLRRGLAMERPPRHFRWITGTAEKGAAPAALRNRWQVGHYRSMRDLRIRFCRFY